MKKFAIALTVGAGVLTAAAAFANHHEGAAEEAAANVEPTFEDTFAGIDTSGDGNVNSEEFMAYKIAAAEKEWAELATVAGEDGLLSLAEAKAHYEAQMNENADT